jgi:hypothetical protein
MTVLIRGHFKGDGSQVVAEPASLEREALTEATLGLTLAQSKTILA